MYKLAVEVEVIALTENPLGGTAITIGIDIEIPKIMVFVGVPAVGNTAAGAVNEALQQTIYTDQLRAARNMQNGGHFAAAISEAYFRADSKNKDKLTAAFADLFKKFNY